MIHTYDFEIKNIVVYPSEFYSFFYQNITYEKKHRTQTPGTQSYPISILCILLRENELPLGGLESHPLGVTPVEGGAVDLWSCFCI